MSDETTAITSQLPNTSKESRVCWHSLSAMQVAAIALTLGIAAVVLFPRVIWGPCFGDPGEVQLTAAIGGVGHPPGQAGIISILRVLCLVSPLPPHVTVSGATAVFALSVVGILMVCMLRTGANPVAAGLCSLLYLTDDQFWHAAATPETYATCFLLLAGAIWSFLSWVHERRAWRLWLAVLLYTFLVVNRAPTITLSVCFIVCIFHNGHARREMSVRPMRKALLVVAIAAICVAIVVGGLWMRDVPGTAYNYLDQSYASLPEFPPGNELAADKVERLWWLLSAKQYDYMFHPTVRTVWAQGHWLLVELGLLRKSLMLAGLAIIALGGAALWKSNRSVAIFVFLMIPATIVPILMIRVVSHTTLLPNLLFALAWLMAMGLTRLMRIHRSAFWQTIVVSAVCFTAWWTAEASFLIKEESVNATETVRAIDLESLPPNATLLTYDVIPLIYSQAVDGVRPDLRILVDHGRLNRAFVESAPGRVFTTSSVPGGLRVEPYGLSVVKELLLPEAFITDD